MGTGIQGAPEIKALMEKGHDVVFVAREVEPEPDLFLAPYAWRMTPDLLKYVEIAVKAARTQRYPKKGDKSDV